MNPKAIAAALGITISVLTLWGFAAPVLQSDAPPWASREGVFKSAEMIREEIHSSLASLRLDMLEARLFNFRKEQCAAIRRGDMRLSASIGAQIQRARVDYSRLSDGASFELRPCDEF